MMHFIIYLMVDVVALFFANFGNFPLPEVQILSGILHCVQFFYVYIHGWLMSE